jgi:hypothetical protein
MLVHFVTDEPNKIPAVRAMLEPRYHIVPRLLGGGDTQKASHGVLMVDADLRKMACVEQIKIVLRELGSIPEKLFVVQNHVRSLVAQAYALGATAVVSRPREIVPKLAQIAAKAAQSGVAAVSPETRIARPSLRPCFPPCKPAKGYAFRTQNTLLHKSSTASRETGLARGLTRCASIMKERSSIVCWSRECRSALPSISGSPVRM